MLFWVWPEVGLLAIRVTCEQPYPLPNNHLPTNPSPKSDIDLSNIKCLLTCVSKSRTVKSPGNSWCITECSSVTFLHCVHKVLIYFHSPSPLPRSDILENPAPDVT